MMKSIDGVRSTEAGTEFFLGGTYSDWGLQVTLSSSSKSAAAVFALQASLNGTDWQTITGSTWQNIDSGSIIWVTGKPASYIRALQAVVPPTTGNLASAWIAAAP